MLFLYRVLINFVVLVSPIIIIIRLLKNKENLSRFKEKFCFFTEKRLNGKIIWFHGASVGELQSVVPLIEKLEKKNEIRQILVTSNTLSSSKIMEKKKFKKVTHQFFPIDTNFFSLKFLNYWRPSFVFFIDSEIWPNMVMNLEKKDIPFGIVNGRITKRSFKKWMIFQNFSKKIFEKFRFCTAASNESKIFLKKLGVKKVKFFGNLKFSQTENEKINFDKSLKKFIKSRKIWCASSTHNSEEIFCGIVHKKLKEKYKNILTIIIPRHIDRVKNIKRELENLNLKTHIHEPKKKIKKNTDVYIVNAYGKTKSFYNNCNNIFLGGSLIEHGGQNPLEATRYGCNVLHGPNVSNFKEIYNFLRKNKVSYQIRTQANMISILKKLLSKKSSSKKIQKKLNSIGQNILQKTLYEINLFFKNEI